MKSTCSNRLPLPNAGEGFWGVRGIPRRRTSSLKTVLDESPRSATEDIQLCVLPPFAPGPSSRAGERGDREAVAFLNGSRTSSLYSVVFNKSHLALDISEGLAHVVALFRAKWFVWNSAETLRARRRILDVLSVLLIVCGFLAILLPIEMSLGVVIVVSWLLLFSGGGQLVHVFSCPGIGDGSWKALIAVFHLGTGFSSASILDSACRAHPGAGCVLRRPGTDRRLRLPSHPREQPLALASLRWRDYAHPRLDDLATLAERFASGNRDIGRSQHAHDRHHTPHVDLHGTPGAERGCAGSLIDEPSFSTRSSKAVWLQLVLTIAVDSSVSHSPDQIAATAPLIESIGSWKPRA